MSMPMVSHFLHRHESQVPYRVSGELEYWLSSIKVFTIILFIIIGTLVNSGVNRAHHPIGFENWRIGEGPFVNGWTGFGRVFVTASFACELSSF